jgi:hypothetical protein
MNRRTITLTREDVQQILHHTHWIAAKNGEQGRFLHKNYPGWTMNSLMTALIEAKCLVKTRRTPKTSGHFSGYQVRATLTTVNIQRHSIS